MITKQDNNKQEIIIFDFIFKSSTSIDDAGRTEPTCRQKPTGSAVTYKHFAIASSECVRPPCFNHRVVARSILNKLPCNSQPLCDSLHCTLSNLNGLFIQCSSSTTKNKPTNLSVFFFHLLYSRTLMMHCAKEVAAPE